MKPELFRAKIVRFMQDHQVFELKALQRHIYGKAYNSDSIRQYSRTYDGIKSHNYMIMREWEHIFHDGIELRMEAAKCESYTEYYMIFQKEIGRHIYIPIHDDKGKRWLWQRVTCFEEIEDYENRLALREAKILRRKVREGQRVGLRLPSGESYKKLDQPTKKIRDLLEYMEIVGE